ncbi:hypothetical protein GCM10023093_31670 [Nemorincola caseinilytica]|uniref:Gliding motility-associated C-terminal domain-containing protein n=2 Tax=Nemorincola caseinilytica TaxID=2054315 RepID=A0ABP8NS45_9BACT
MVQVSHFSGPVAYGTQTVTVTSSGSITTANDTCLGSPLQYHAGLSGAGKYEFALSSPIYGIWVQASNLNAGPFGTSEYLEVFINGVQYVITPADVLSYDHCGSAGADTCYLTSGRLYGPEAGAISLSHYNGGVLHIKMCSGITSFSVGSNGNANGVSYHVSIDTLPMPPCEVIAASNAPLCDGPVLNLYANSTNIGTYVWTGPGGFTSTLQNPTIPAPAPTVSGTYTVVHTVGLMTYTDTIEVAVFDAPVVTATSNSPVCEGDTLSFRSSPYVPGITYNWEGSAGFASTLQNPDLYFISSLQMGTYTLYTDLYGCKDTVELFVVTTLPLNPMISVNDPVCEGRDLSLSVSPIFAGQTYSWSGPESFTGTSQSPLISPAKLVHSGQYSVVVSLDGCDNTATRWVTVLPSPDITATSNSPLCTGDTLFLMAGYPGAVMDTSVYTWAGPGGFSSEHDTSLIYGINPDLAGTYRVVAAMGSCYDTVYVPVEVNPIPTLIAMVGGPVCEGEDVLLASGPTDVLRTFEWAGPGGFTSGEQYHTIKGATRTASGTYTVTTTLKGCVNSTIVNVNIVPLPAPLRDTIICNDMFVGLGLEIALPPDATVYWSTRETTDKIYVQETGKYWMQMTAPGCITSDTVYIAGELCGCGMTVPNAFTPNGDGTNDVFAPIIAKGCNIVQYQFAVYDRWANKVFLTQDMTQKWDGTFNGRTMDIGMYMYLVSYKVATGKEQVLRGDVTLVR